MLPLISKGSSMSIVLIASALVLCAGNTASKTQVCPKGLKKCYMTFVHNARQHITRTEICRDVSVFVMCILELECDFTEKIKSQAFDTVETHLAKKGLRCEEISKLKDTYINKEPNPKPSIETRSRLSEIQSPNVPKSTKDGARDTVDLPAKSPVDSPATPKAVETGPHSSRRSRRLPRPVTWSNWKSVKNNGSCVSCFVVRTITMLITVLNILFVESMIC